MYKIAVIGDKTSAMGFKALGLDVFFAENGDEARRTLHEQAAGEYAIIYITETLAAQIPAEIERYKDRLTPAVILIPGREGPLGIGSTALRSAVERAVGANIL